ncbi:hypothetical protein WU86_01195 [Corynebacterium xerosis]|nr:hypothetical protein WU86_01195 [Corynebacterium xerosis]
MIGALSSTPHSAPPRPWPPPRFPASPFPFPPSLPPASATVTGPTHPRRCPRRRWWSPSR